jgi:hypothetical protein
LQKLKRERSIVAVPRNKGKPHWKTTRR